MKEKQVIVYGCILFEKIQTGTFRRLSNDFSLAIINSTTKRNLGKKCFRSPYTLLSILWSRPSSGSKDRTRGQELKQRGRLLAVLLPGSNFTASYTARGHLSRDSTAHSLTLPTSTSNQKNAPQICPEVNLMETQDNPWVPLPRTLRLTRETKEDRNDNVNSFSTRMRDYCITSQGCFPL